MLDIISLISLLIIITMLRRIANVLPSVYACAWRWKECVNLDAVVKLSRDRDFTALALIIPFCLMLNRYGVVSLRFMKEISPEAGFGVILGIFILYVGFRFFAAKVFLPQKSRKSSRVSDYSDRTFFIILVMTGLACSGILALFNAGTEVTRHSIIWLSAAIYILYLVRKFQIFQSSYPIFSAFLYLCALEIIPTGTFVVSAIIF